MDAMGRMVDEAREAIVDYLRIRPGAADTAEGIARWWVYPATGENDLDVVRTALDLLEQRGEVEPQHVRNRLLYRAGPALRGG